MIFECVCLGAGCCLALGHCWANTRVSKPRCTLVGSLFVSFSSFWRPGMATHDNRMRGDLRNLHQHSLALLQQRACCVFSVRLTGRPSMHSSVRHSVSLSTFVLPEATHHHQLHHCHVSQPPANPGCVHGCNRRQCSLQNIRWCSSTTCLPWTRFSAGLRLSVLKRRKKWKRCWIAR